MNSTTQIWQSIFFEKEKLFTLGLEMLMIWYYLFNKQSILSEEILEYPEFDKMSETVFSKNSCYHKSCYHMARLPSFE